ADGSQPEGPRTIWRFNRAAGVHDLRMAGEAVSRTEIIESVTGVLEALPWVDAMWEGGSAAFGRVDEWSDVDLQAIAEDARTLELFEIVEATLKSMSPIKQVYRVPEPAWHGHSQRFYELEKAGPFLMVDFCVMKRSSANRFLEREIHGGARFIFDRSGVAAGVKPGDPEAWDTRLRDRLAQLTGRFRMFQPLVTKDCLRGRPLDAAHFYQSLTLVPLVEMLRIKHDPWRHNFGWRYLQHDLPAEDYARLVRLAYPGSVEAIPALHEEAVRWFEELAAELAARSVLTPRRALQGRSPPARTGARAPTPGNGRLRTSSGARPS
ncbi:MAG TPA: hypothetical protein VIK52_01325, partial [Opitutaceae bacterium]